MPRSQTALTGIVLVPFLAVTAGLAAVALAELGGATPFSDGPPRSAAEAAAKGSAADLVRLLRLGDDPLAVRQIRPIGDRPAVQRTALEAVVESKTLAMVRLIDREGVIVGDDTRRTLACLAVDLQANDIASYLVADGTASCAPGEALERVRARETSGPSDR
jgi:hypothetical protein